ncbi:hypothetical protein MMC13_000723 [Lambiella insularis]|nr:hypothetical protein [Lambiella insularis]
MSARRLSRKTVVALNRALDEAEDFLAWDAPKTSTDRSHGNSGLGIEDDVFVKEAINAQPITPPYSTILNTPEEVMPERHEMKQEQNAEPMMERIDLLVRELQKRQDDFKHIHNIVIAKAEQDEESIVQLRSNIGQLEADVDDDHSELTYLKLKLRILEIQGLPNVPLAERNSLAQGTQRWKLDWADVDNQFRKRRRKWEVREKGAMNACPSAEYKETSVHET